MRWLCVSIQSGGNSTRLAWTTACSISRTGTLSTSSQTTRHAPISNGTQQYANQCSMTVASSATRGDNGAISPLSKQSLQGWKMVCQDWCLAYQFCQEYLPGQPSCALVARQPCHLANTRTEAALTCRLTARPYTSGMTGSTSTMTCAQQVRILSYKLPGHCPKP